MIYRIVATFEKGHPRLSGKAKDLPLISYRRGAWRVLDSFSIHAAPMHPIVYTVRHYVGTQGVDLWTISDRPHKAGTLFNPHRALKRALAARREAA
jgi:hypothetical protein